MIYKYSEAVLNDKIVTGDLVKLACQRFQNDLDRDDVYFDEEKAAQVINFIEKGCKHWKGVMAGKPMKLEDHQKFFFGNIYGWRRKENNLRRFRTVYKQVARKNGKTTESALSSNFHILKDGPQGAQVWVGANKEDQAKILVTDAANILQESDEFRKLIEQKKIKILRYAESAKKIVYFPKKSFIAPLGRDSKTQDGFDPSKGTIDEYHEAKDDSLLNIIESGMGARLEPLLEVITTAGYNKAGPCYSKLRKTGVDVLKGIIEDDFYFPLIYELDEQDDWKDIEMWIKANPNLNISVYLDYLKTRFIKAKNEGGSKEVDFKTKNLNMWTDSAEVFIRDEFWVANHDARFNQKDLEGEFCWGGMDLAQTRDLNSYAKLFKMELWGKTRFPVLLWNWIPEDNIQYRGMDYSNWVRDGFIFTTPGNHSNQAQILEWIKEDEERHPTRRVHYDRYLAEWLVPAMSESGIECVPRALVGSSLSQAMKRMETIILAGEAIHFMNPVFRWSNSNLVPRIDAHGNYGPDKKESEFKIDPMVSFILAVDAMLYDEAEEEKESGVVWG